MKINKGKVSQALLSVMLFAANIFINMPCKGKCYEPVAPRKETNEE